MAGRPTEQELDALYSAPFAEFVSRRNELAKTLAAEGEDEASAAVRRLTKPALSAWAINRLALAHGDGLEQLLAAGDGLRAAQSAGDGGALRTATEERKAAVSRLHDLALEEIATQGSAASSAISGRVRSTLEALAAWGTANAPDPPPGRLDGDVEPPGFEALLGLMPKAQGPRRVAARGERSGNRPTSETAARKPRATAKTARRSEPSKPKVTVAQRQAAREAVERAREKVEEAAAERTRAGREEGGLRRQVERLGRTVRLAEERLERERAKLVEVEAELERVRSAIERARFGEAEARAELARAEEAQRELKP